MTERMVVESERGHGVGAPEVVDGPLPSRPDPSRVGRRVAGLRSFAAGLTAVTALGVLLRLIVAFTVLDPGSVPGDAVYFRDVAASLAAGEGYVHPPPGGGPEAPSATHPPLLPALLALAGVVGADSLAAQRVLLAVVSGAGVALVGAVGRRVAGPAVGLTAAAIAAVHPLWLQPPGLLMSEALYAVVVGGALLAAVQLRRAPVPWRGLVLGLLIGAAALVRSEALALAVVLGVPAALLTVPATSRRARALALAAVVAGTVLVVGPWVARNADVFGRPLLSTNAGVTMAGANCEAAVTGARLGGFSAACGYAAAGLVLQDPPPSGDRWDEGAIDRALFELGASDARDHGGRLVVVAGARIARAWGVQGLADNLTYEVGEGRDPALQWAGQALQLVLLPAAVAGALVAARRRWRGDLAVLLAGPALVTVVAAAVYGSTRMRVAAEPALAILGAVAVVAAARAWSARRTPRTTTDADAPAVPGADPSPRADPARHCADLQG
jgi:hypothetical protein